MKAYKNMDFGTLWEAYLIEEIDGAQYTSGNGIATQKLQYITPIGVNFNNFMFAYTYSRM
jgi:hypothetical protein